MVSFLRARLAEDEAYLRELEAVLALNRIPQAAATGSEASGRSLFGTSAARVLREVEAKRKILAEHERGVLDGDLFPCDTLRALASIYSDHPDCDPDWSAGA